MRICFVVGMFPALSETFILEQITGLMDRGHEVSILAGARSPEALVHDKVLRYGLLSRARYYNDKPAARLARLGKFLWLLPSFLWRAPGPALRSLNIFRYGREAWSLNLFFQAHAFSVAQAYDIVLCHFGPCGLQGLRMKELGIVTGKLVTVFHASDISAYVRRCGRNVYQDLFSKGDLFLAVSEYARQKLLELGCPAAKIRVHAMGIDVTAFPDAGNLRFTGPGMKILSVARLVAKKGLIYALEAMAILAREKIAFEYTIIGDGPLRAALQADIQRLGLGSCVTLAGARDAHGVREAMARADILLAPSIRAENGDEEGIPVALMEAMAGGTIVVTTATGGIGELVINEKNGFLVEEKSAAAIADRVRSLPQAPDLKDIAAAARCSVIPARDSATLNRDLERILKEITDA